MRRTQQHRHHPRAPTRRELHGLALARQTNPSSPILHDPEASAYGLTPGHRWVGRLITLPNDIPHLPADEELPTPEALALRNEQRRANRRLRLSPLA